MSQHDPNPRARREKLLVREMMASGETVVYDLANDTAHCLNRSVALVFRHCDGSSSVAEIARAVTMELDQAFGIAARGVDGSGGACRRDEPAPGAGAPGQGGADRGTGAADHDHHRADTRSSGHMQTDRSRLYIWTRVLQRVLQQWHLRLTGH